MERRSYLILSIGVLFAIYIVPAAHAEISSLSSKPQTIVIGTLKPGTVAYSAGLALADLLNKYTTLKVAIMPQTGEPAIHALLKEGAVQMGLGGAPGAVLTNRGTPLSKGKGQPLQLLHPMYAMEVALVAAADTNIHTNNDVRGKRIPAYFKGSPEIELDLLGQLAMRGLTYKDVIPVPVTSWQEGGRAVIERKADVMVTGLSGSPIVQELLASRGIRPIPGDDSPEAVKRVKEAAPGYLVVTLSTDDPSLKWLKGNPNFPGKIIFTQYWYYLFTAPEFSDEVAYDISKAVWMHYKEISPANPRFPRDWKPENMVTGNAVIPYHPGAIKWFKEKGAWTSEMEQLQKRLLAESVK